jgi:hypothetical protein
VLLVVANQRKLIWYKGKGLSWNLQMEPGVGVAFLSVHHSFSGASVYKEERHSSGKRAGAFLIITCG